MPNRRRTSYLWVKHVPPLKREEWEERLGDLDPTRLVVLESSRRKSIRFEFHAPSRPGAEELRERFGGAVQTLEERNWQALVESRPTLVKIRDALVITSERDEKKVDLLRRAHPGRTLLRVPAEMAFGTGDHATTATCLRYLVDTVRQMNREGIRPARMLDLGTGTGVLGLAAGALGIPEVTGIDFDLEAVKAARRNAARHGWQEPEMRIDCADVLTWNPPEGQRSPVIAANLFHDLLVESLPRIIRWIEPGGYCIISGILREQSETCFQAAEKAGWRVADVKRSGKWVAALLAALPGSPGSGNFNASGPHAAKSELRRGAIGNIDAAARPRTTRAGGPPGLAIMRQPGAIDA